MQVTNSTQELRNHLHKRRLAGESIGLVPTMGNLHSGHLKLVAAAKSATDCVVATIFVNPLQFGPGEDLDSYPRTMEQDQSRLTSAGCDFLFAPSDTEIFGDNTSLQTTIHVPGISEGYCGASRPGHFDGVATIVNKLFNITRPDQAFFGLKDYQQFLLIRIMVRDLMLDISVVGVETEREADGLALSSRNNYLSASQREKAPTLYQQLQSTADSIQQGARDFAALQAQACQQLVDAGMRPDYFTVCNAETLEAATSADNDLAILAAAFVGDTRLIDNLRFTR